MLLTSMIAILMAGPAMAADNTAAGTYDPYDATNHTAVTGGCTTPPLTIGSANSITGQWTPNTITLSWNVNGHGSLPESPTPPTTCTYDTTFTAPAMTNPVGYTFGGWSVNGNTLTSGQANVSCDYATLGQSNNGSTANITAIWNVNVYNITMKQNGGRINDSTNDTNVYEKYATGWYTTAAASTPVSNDTVSVPTRDGYTFRGYFNVASAPADVTSNNNSTNIIAKDGSLPANTTFTSDTTVYAAWAKNCTTPTINGQAAGTCSLTVNNDGSVSYSTSCNSGYTEDLSTKNTATPICTANGITLNWYAKPGDSTTYEQNTCDYTFDISLPTTNPTRTGYTFTGRKVGNN